VAPVIVDIVDKHSMYRGQWRKRLAYYRQCTYKLETWAHGGQEAKKVEHGKTVAVEDTPRDLNTLGCLLD